MNILEAPKGLYWVNYPRGGGVFFFKYAMDQGIAIGQSSLSSGDEWIAHEFDCEFVCQPIGLREWGGEFFTIEEHAVTERSRRNDA